MIALEVKQSKIVFIQSEKIAFEATLVRLYLQLTSATVSMIK